MNLADLLVIAVLVLAVALAVFFSVRRKRKGKGCCGVLFFQNRFIGSSLHCVVEKGNSQLPDDYIIAD